MSWMTTRPTLKMTGTQLTRRHSVRNVTHINRVVWGGDGGSRGGGRKRWEQIVADLRMRMRGQDFHHFVLEFPRPGARPGLAVLSFAEMTEARVVTVTSKRRHVTSVHMATFVQRYDVHIGVSEQLK